MQWGLLIRVILAAPAAAAVLFEPPFAQTDFALSGAAAAAGDSVELVRAPGQAGAVWMRAPVSYAEWTLEAVSSSRADFQNDAGTAGYASWYTAEPQTAASDAAAPSHGGADVWDGLAVMVDNLVGHGQGAVRGHLSDGSARFSEAAADVEADALSSCHIDYRRAASPIPVRIGYSDEGFVVTVSGQKCFLSTELASPSEYYFGVSANSDRTTDVSTVKSSSVTPGMHPDSQAFLPSHQNTKTNQNTNTNTNNNANSNANSNTNSNTNSNSNNANSANNANALTKNELIQISQPTLDRIELMDVKVKQVQSALDQLADTLSSSMAEAGPAKGGADVSGVQKDSQISRTQLSEYHKAAASGQPARAGPVASPTSWTFVLASSPVQSLVIISYHGWSRRRESHEKLL